MVMARPITGELAAKRLIHAAKTGVFASLTVAFLVSTGAGQELAAPMGSSEVPQLPSLPFDVPERAETPQSVPDAPAPSSVAEGATQTEAAAPAVQSDSDDVSANATEQRAAAGAVAPVTTEQAIASVVERVEETPPVPLVTEPRPHVQSIAEGQAQRVRSASRVLAEREGVVSAGAGLRLEVTFGREFPVLICKIDLTCLIELEDGEELIDTPLLSDPVRWEIALRVRDEPLVKTYAALKARIDAEEATLALFTNRRAYYILLVPDLREHTPMLAFHYPDTEQAKIAARLAERREREASATQARQQARAARVAQSGVPTERGVVPADELDFNFRISGKAAFKPVRVYTDGRRTYVDLPEGYRGEMPALVATGAADNAAVNVTVKDGGQKLIVDRVLSAFSLLAGGKKIHVQKGS